jgi:hypothetical protein
MATPFAFKIGFVVSGFVLGISGVKPAHAAVDSTDPQPAADAPQQEQFDREKVTLKDKTQESIDSADANIDALHRMAKSADEQKQKQYKDIADDFSMLRGHLKDDLSKIDKASIHDWGGVKPAVERDVSAVNAALQRATSLTHVQAPASQP